MTPQKIENGWLNNEVPNAVKSPTIKNKLDLNKTPTNSEKTQQGANLGEFVAFGKGGAK